MASDWYTPDNAHIMRVMQDDMTAWRNAEAKLIDAECVATNELIGFRLFEPIAIDTPVGTGTSYLPKYRTSSYAPGFYQEICFLQAGFDLFPAMGKCTTSDDTPDTDLYTHAITIRTTQTPLNMARHLERENTTDAESERIDVFGMLLRSYHAECSETSQVATQMTEWDVASTLNTGTDNITAKALTDVPFKWNNFTFPTFTYGGETIEASIIGWSFDIINTTRLTGLDSTGKYSVGRYVPQTHISTTLEIIPYGHNVFELIRDASPYATDLDLTVAATRTATNDLITFTHDKMYATPFDIAVSKNAGAVESYYLRMHQLNTGSLAISVVDDYNDEYYEGE